MAALTHIRHKQFLRGILCLFVCLSFFGTLAPIAGASSNKSNAMPCCVGKAAGHCDSGIIPKKAPPRAPEPMCGLDNSGFDDDEITIVAEASHIDSHHASQSASLHSAAEPLSIAQPCQMDCGACAAVSSRQQKRERGVVQSTSDQNTLPTAHSRLEQRSFSFSSNEDWEQSSPRGPPGDLC